MMRTRERLRIFNNETEGTRIEEKNGTEWTNVEKKMQV